MNNVKKKQLKCKPGSNRSILEVLLGIKQYYGMDQHSISINMYMTLEAGQKIGNSFDHNMVKAKTITFKFQFLNCCHEHAVISRFK